MRGSIASKVTGVGVLLALYGLVSSVLYFFDYNLRILMWVDVWGPLVGWGLRIGFILGGGALAFAASFFDPANDPEVIAANARAEEEARIRRESHPRRQHVLAEIAKVFPITFDAPADPSTYRVRAFMWQDDGYSHIDQKTGVPYEADDPRATRAMIFVERGDGTRSVLGYDFVTSSANGPHEAHPSSWATYVR